MRHSLAALVLAVLATAAHAVERLEVTSLKPLLRSAAVSGEAHGVFVGPLAERMRVKFGTDSPILLDVVAVASLPQPGCKRLQVTTTQDGVHEQDRKTKVVGVRDAKMAFKISFCSDGGFPAKERKP
jgi:hypothetical protein